VETGRDVLTGLPNERYLLLRLEEEIVRAHRHGALSPDCPRRERAGGDKRSIAAAVW
jgi:GGDEF domain-containing protein